MENKEFELLIQKRDFMDIRTEMCEVEDAFNKLIAKAEKEKEAGKVASVSEIFRFANIPNKLAAVSLLIGIAKEEDFMTKKKSWKFWKKG